MDEKVPKKQKKMERNQKEHNHNKQKTWRSEPRVTCVRTPFSLPAPGSISLWSWNQCNTAVFLSR